MLQGFLLSRRVKEDSVNVAIKLVSTPECLITNKKEETVIVYPLANDNNGGTKRYIYIYMYICESEKI